MFACWRPGRAQRCVSFTTMTCTMNSFREALGNILGRVHSWTLWTPAELSHWATDNRWPHLDTLMGLLLTFSRFYEKRVWQVSEVKTMLSPCCQNVETEFLSQVEIFWTEFKAFFLSLQIESSGIHCFSETPFTFPASYWPDLRWTTLSRNLPFHYHCSALEHGYVVGGSS